MMSMPARFASNHRRRFSKWVTHSRRGRMRWHGVCAWPVYAVSLGKTLLVGIEALGPKEVPTRPFDRVNAEVTTLVALKQHEHRKCHTAFAALIRNRQPFELWQVDIACTHSRVLKHYFAQIEPRLIETNITLSAVVSFVIQQWEHAESSYQTDR